MTVDSIRTALASHSVDIEHAESAYDLESIESAPDFIEWLEKTNGDVHQAFRLYGLGESFPTPDAPEQIEAWWNWSRHDPADPETFKCAGCSQTFHIVEATGGNWHGSDVLAVGERWGDLRDFRLVTDASQNLYNYELGTDEHADSDYTHICSSCREDFTGRVPKVNVIFYQGPEETVEIRHKSHVAYRPDNYWDLRSEDREALDSLIQYNGTPEDWTRVYPTGPRESKDAHIRTNIKRWLRSWASPNHFTDRPDYPEDFPAIVKYANHQGKVGGGGLYVPDYPKVIEVAEGWLDGVAADFRRGSDFGW